MEEVAGQRTEPETSKDRDTQAGMEHTLKEDWSYSDSWAHWQTARRGYEKQISTCARVSWGTRVLDIRCPWIVLLIFRTI